MPSSLDRETQILSDMVSAKKAEHLQALRALNSPSRKLPTPNSQDKTII